MTSIIRLSLFLYLLMLATPVLGNEFNSKFDESSEYQDMLTRLQIPAAYAQENGDAILHSISVNGSDFTVRTIITSGAVVKNVTLDINSKTLTVEFEDVEGISKVQFMTLIIESEMLGGQYTVMYDDFQAELNRHYSVGLQEGYAIFAIAFPNDVSKISVMGTTVAPEFGLTHLVAGLGILLSIAYMRGKGVFKNLF